MFNGKGMNWSFKEFTFNLYAIIPTTIVYITFPCEAN